MTHRGIIGILGLALAGAAPSACGSDGNGGNVTDGGSDGIADGSVGGTGNGGTGAGKATGGLPGTGGKRATGGYFNEGDGSTHLTTGGAPSGGAAPGDGGPDGPPPDLDGGTDAIIEAGDGSSACRDGLTNQCAEGYWYSNTTNLGCSACPAPDLTCSELMMDKATFTVSGSERTLRIVVPQYALEVKSARMHVLWGSGTCATDGPNSTYFNATLESDPAGTALVARLDNVSSNAMPCGMVELDIVDGCCEPRHVRLNVVYDADADKTYATCPQATCQAVHAVTAGSPSGHYALDLDDPPATATTFAYCDMTTAGGGWTRVNGLYDAADIDTVRGASGRQMLKCSNIDGPPYIVSPTFGNGWSWNHDAPYKIGGDWNVNGTTKACGTDAEWDDATCPGTWGVGCSNGAGANDKLFPGLLATPEPKTCGSAASAHTDGAFTVCGSDDYDDYSVFLRSED